jgi:PAS domain S-box-containing protein
VRDLTERRQVEEALKKNEDHLKKLMDSIRAGIIVIDAQTHQIVEINSFALELIGGEKNQILGRMCHQCICPAEIGKCPITNLKQKVDHSERVLIKSNRDRIPILKSVVPIMREDKIYLIESFIDITELKRAEQEKIILEEQLRQSQKMEAIGKLAGGVAHDFNNLLTVIHGYSELLLNSLDQNSRLRQDVLEIKNASQRASSLTNQLLAFSRKQVLQPTVLDLNAHVSSMDKMLRRMIGENIKLTSLLAEDLGRIKADPGQIEQVILNLAINAKDAMPNGGKLTIETANVILDESFTRSRIGMAPGRYVMLSMSDTGSGMTPEVKERIFDPFFTTKEKGKGTGLGLATVYGIIQQSGGNIWVYSEPGVGTTFKIYLPTIEEGTESLRPTSVPTKSTQGSETILLVEDEEMVRKLACTVLQKNGYKVLEASSGEEALRIVQGQNGNPIHLMVTDVVMPGMSGRQLAERLLPLRPEMKVLYMSGYTDDAIVHHGVLDPGIAYIQKPFAPDALASKVRDILDGRKSPT